MCSIRRLTAAASCVCLRAPSDAIIGKDLSVEDTATTPETHPASFANESADLYGVVGRPVSQSRSPFIHGLFARTLQQRMVYRKFDVGPDDFRRWVLEFFTSGGRGLNVTLPHKQAAAALASELTPRADRAGAVNTLSFRDDRILGDNTDGAGLVRDLRDNLNVSISGAAILILGAGGATRGVLAPLLALDPRHILIANRTPERAQTLASSFGDLGAVRGCSFSDIDAAPFDIVINATSAGLTGDMPTLEPRIVGPDTLCYDFVYGHHGTPFLRWAQEHGCQRLTPGWGMLVEQAAESFQVWRGVRPETQAVIAVLASDPDVPYPA